MDIKSGQTVLPPQVQAQLLDAQRRGPAITPANSGAGAGTGARDEQRFIADPEGDQRALSTRRRPSANNGEDFSTDTDLDDARQSVNRLLNREAPLGRNSVRAENERQIEPGQILDIRV